MPRLPVVGEDLDEWGSILNDFLRTQHAEDGSHAAVTAPSVTTDDVLARGPRVDVRAMGARGDGTTDDTAAIQAAIDRARVRGGCVYVPAGHYLCGPLTLANVAIVGDAVVHDPSFAGGSLGSMFHIRNASAPFMTIAGTAVTLSGLGFFYPDQDGSSSTPHVFPATVKTELYRGTTDVRISDCLFANCYDAIDLTADPNWVIGRCYIDRCTIYGISRALRVTTARDVVSVVNCLFGVAAYGLSTHGAANLGRFTASYGTGIVLDRADGFMLSHSLFHGFATSLESIAGVYSLRVAGCLFEGMNGVVLRGYASGYLTGNGFWTSHAYDETLAGRSVLIDANQQFQGFTVNGNTFHYSTGEHVRISGPEQVFVAISGNHIRSWARPQGGSASRPMGGVVVAAPRALVTLSGNTFRADAVTPTPERDGVQFTGGEAVNITGNVFSGCRRAIWGTGGSACLVSGNLVQETLDPTTSISVSGVARSLVTANLADKAVIG